MQLKRKAKLLTVIGLNTKQADCRIIFMSFEVYDTGSPGVCFTKVFRTELGHKYILVKCSVIALCLPVMSKITRYKLVCYK